MSLTDEIYGELMDRLRTGLDYDRLRLKWEKSKGPFYNALQRVFGDVGTDMAQLSSRMKALQEGMAEGEARLAELADHQRKAESEAEAKRRDLR